MTKFFGISCFEKAFGASFNIFTVGEKSKEVRSALFSELQEKRVSIMSRCFFNLKKMVYMFGILHLLIKSS